MNSHNLCRHGVCPECSGWCRSCQIETVANFLCGLPAFPAANTRISAEFRQAFFNLYPQKNSKKTVRQIMDEEENALREGNPVDVARRLVSRESPLPQLPLLNFDVVTGEELPISCDRCHRRILGKYAIYGVVGARFEYVYHIACIPPLLQREKEHFYASALESLRQCLATGEKGVPKIPDAPDTRHAVTERAPTAVLTYGHVKLLMESHSELLRALKYLQKDGYVKAVNESYIASTILRAENASK